ncbi:MAG: efflux RND transporter periplasmic adaptor subunit [Gammaproteobacteria bacterium]|jgi:membrane fusion protein (multidrug efflux system)
MKRKKLFIIILILLVVLTISTIILHTHRTKHKNNIKPTVLVKAIPVKTINTPVTVNAVGTLIAPEQTSVRSKTDGYITQVFFESGQYVHQGDILLTLNDIRTKADLLSAKAVYFAAKAKYTRALKLQQKGYFAKQDVDSLYANMQNKLALQQEAQDALNKKTIRAPFTGYLGKRIINVGDYIQSGQKIVELVNRKQLKAEYSLPEQYLSQIKLGQQITITAASLPKKVFYGKVSFIAPSIDDQTHTIALQATVPNQHNTLAPGLFVTVIQTLDTARPVILIPEQSLIRTLDTATIFKVVNHRAKSIAVKVGDLKNGNIEILSGLSKKDIVIVIGQNKVKDGDNVKIINFP